MGAAIIGLISLEGPGVISGFNSLAGPETKGAVFVTTALKPFTASAV